MREVNTKQHKTQTRKINKFELLSVVVMMTDSLILFLSEIGDTCNDQLFYLLDSIHVIKKHTNKQTRNDS